MNRTGLTIWTVGHSTRTVSELLSVVAAHDVELIADVRRYPGSRRLPHFESGALEKSLADAGISYRWLPSLGGRRAPNSSSVNTGWTHPAFRAYADHVETEEFAEGLTELLTLAYGLNTAVMCAELLWWRCHRRIIADVLVSIGVNVIHIRDESVAALHGLAPPARIVDGELSYQAEENPGGQITLGLET